MDIGKRLKSARQSIGYTLADVETKCGIGASSLSDFENSKREPKFSQLSRLASVYRKSVEYFLQEEVPAESVMLWREQPSETGEMAEVEARFRELCEQYRNLEIVMDEVNEPCLPEPDIERREAFDYAAAESLARKVRREFSLGEVPIVSLKKTLEEKYFIKIFYLDFSGSAISTVSESIGRAILLNKKNKQWRRSFDLAHELFHLLTWKIFRKEGGEGHTPSGDEERFANAFASELLMPVDALKDRLRPAINEEGQISFDRLDDIAREYDVSLQALLYRIKSICKLKKEETEKYIDEAVRYMNSSTPRLSTNPPTFPERYCDLAVRALRQGKLSLMKFRQYMDISYKEAESYVREGEEITDEKISISFA